MYLVVSMRIFLCPDPPIVLVNYARKCIRFFVQAFSSIYGAESVVYNVHSVLHIPDDFDRFGSLNNISSFPFESFNGDLKKYIKRPGSELEQVVKRIHENLNVKRTSTQTSDCAELKGSHTNGPLGTHKGKQVHQYYEVRFRKRFFKVDSRNDCVWFDNSYGRIVNILKVDNHIIFLVKCFVEVCDVFSFPCKSSKVGIVYARSLSSRIRSVHIRDVTKCLCIAWHGGKFYCVKLLHEI